jgi:hypothetical protein
MTVSATSTAILFRITISTNESVEGFKKDIQSQEGVPVELQTLTFGVTQLEDARLLSDYQILAGSLILLTVETAAPSTDPPSHDQDLKFSYLVNIKLFDGGAFTILTPERGTVETLKTLIQR